MSGLGARWRADIDSLAFRPPGHMGECVVHRRALRSLIGHDPTPEEALALHRQEADGFARAAAAKIAKARLSPSANFHLTSRDLRRQRDVAPRLESAAPNLDTNSPRQ
jgi:hypothetical protein